MKNYCLLASLLLLHLAALGQNVGIGTTAPTQTLDVNGQLRVRGLSGSGSRLPQVQPDGTLSLSAPLYQTGAVSGAPAGAIGTAATGISPFSVAVSGTTAYVVNASSSSLQVFDVSASSAPTLLSTAATGNIPVGVAVSGPTAYVVNQGSNSLQVFDVSAPSAPTLLSTVATGSYPYSVAVSGPTAYVVNHGSNSLQVFVSPTASRVITVGADGALASVAAPTLSVSGQSLSISGGNTVTLPTPPGDNLGNHTATQNLNLAAYQLVGNGGTQGLSLSKTGQVGIGTSSPVGQLANTSSNIGGTDSFGLSGSSLAWATSAQGYAAGFYNGATGYGANGLVVKVADNSSLATALDVNAGAIGAASASLLRVRADGNVGIGVASPAARLDVAGYARLAGGGVPAGVSGATASVPAVAVLELDATLPTAANSQVFLTHGLANDHILSITALATGASGNTLPPNFTFNSNGELYGIYLYGNQVVLQAGPAGTSAGILGKPVRVLITYRQ